MFKKKLSKSKTFQKLILQKLFFAYEIINKTLILIIHINRYNPLQYDAILG